MMRAAAPVMIATALACGHAAAGADNHSATTDDADAAALRATLDLEPALEASAQIQFRYDLNLRDGDSAALNDPDDDLTAGFSLRRTRVTLAGRVSESVKGTVQFEFSRSTGEGVLNEAYADWAVSEGLGLRIGQKKVHFLRETTVGSKRQLAPEASVMDSVFGQDDSQMVEASFGGDRWRGWVAFSDGFDSRNTSFSSSDDADYALTGRAEVRFGRAGFKRFDQFTSFRGADAGGLLGAAVHWQSTGDTNPSAPEPTELLTATADFSWLGDGWNAAVIGVWRKTDDGTDRFDDFGALAQAGVFVSGRCELFGRWDAVFPDDARGAAVDDFHTITVGVNHYIIPESHAAKLTLAVQCFLDAPNDTGGVVRPSDGVNLLADSEEGQIGVTAQLQLLF